MKYVTSQIDITEPSAYSEMCLKRLDNLNPKQINQIIPNESNIEKARAYIIAECLAKNKLIGSIRISDTFYSIHYIDTASGMFASINVNSMKDMK